MISRKRALVSESVCDGISSMLLLVCIGALLLLGGSLVTALPSELSVNPPRGGSDSTMMDLSKCNAEKSTSARALLETQVYPLAEAHGYTWPDSCPLNRRNDALRVLEDGVRVQRKYWKCQTCGKRFTERSFADAHFRNEHLHSDLVCLAEYCRVLQCPGYEVPPPSICDAQEMQRRRFQCSALVQQCAPLDSGSADTHRFNELLMQLLCSPLSCDPSLQQQRWPTSVQERSLLQHPLIRGVLGGCLVALFLGLSLAIYVERIDKRMLPDLRFLGRKPGVGWIEWICRKRRRKVKGY